MKTNINRTSKEKISNYKDTANYEHGLLRWLSGKESACQCRRCVSGGYDPLEEAMATHSSILAWRISWTEEPGRLQSTGSQELDMT